MSWDVIESSSLPHTGRAAEEAGALDEEGVWRPDRVSLTLYFVENRMEISSTWQGTAS